MTTFARLRVQNIILLVFALTVLSACRLDMRDQPRIEPYEQSTLFADQSSSRPRLEDTVARGELSDDLHLTTGRIGNRYIDSFPFTVTVQTLVRGQERYTIFCTPCHGALGDGTGIVTEYGMRTPTSFHDPELRTQPAGYYFALISDGTRVMPGYAARIPVEDRWAIVAYIRALQLSQGADTTQLPPEELSKLGSSEVITK